MTQKFKIVELSTLFLLNGMLESLPFANDNDDLIGLTDTPGLFDTFEEAMIHLEYNIEGKGAFAIIQIFIKE